MIQSCIEGQQHFLDGGGPSSRAVAAIHGTFGAIVGTITGQDGNFGQPKDVLQVLGGHELYRRHRS